MRKITVIPILIVSILVAISLPSSVQAASEPITLRLAGPHFPITLDPQRAEDVDSVDHIANLFAGLTDVDPVMGKIRPSLATAWQQDAAGQVWTFTLRNDVPWVKWDARSQTVTKVRNVTAQDFVDGIRRSCDPRLNAFYTWVAAGIIQGCEKVARLDKTQIKDSDFDQIAVRAVSDTQLEITTKGNLPYFLSTTSYWMFRPIPKEVTDQYGDAWTTASNIVTDGPFVLTEYTKNGQAVYVRNPLYPQNVHTDRAGNIQRIIYTSTGNNMPIRSYFSGLIEIVDVPLSSAQDVLANLDNLLQNPYEVVNFVNRPSPAVFYFGFMEDKPPFDKVEVRRAISAAIDRSGFSDKYGGQVTGHFTPPGIYGGFERGNPDADLGTDGYDPDYAKAQLSAAGFPNCKGFPTINVETTETAPGLYLQQMMQESLDCPASRVRVRKVEPDQLYKDIKPGAKNRPDIALLGWAPDYPDANNWMHDVLSCHAENDLQRPCTDIDQQIDRASALPYGPDRITLYHTIEKAFFATDGQFPIAPLVVYNPLTIVKPWLHGPINTDGRFGGYHWEMYNIDQAAQKAAQRYMQCGCPN